MTVRGGSIGDLKIQNEEVESDERKKENIKRKQSCLNEY